MFRRGRVATRARTGWAHDEVRGASRGWPSGDTAFRTRPRAMSGKGAVINWGRIVQKRAKKGLFAGKTTHFGNRGSEDGGNKSRRTWKPSQIFEQSADFGFCLNRTSGSMTFEPP